MEYIENSYLKAAVSPHGAELSSLYLKSKGLEAIWQADPKYWNRHAPVLFPFVGKVNGGVYRYHGKEYSMGQHGFARDCDFELVSKSADSVSFRLVSDEKSLEKFPMPFELTITHRLEGDALRVCWEVRNPSDSEPLYFSIGGHPAFNVPAIPGTEKHDYFVKFETLQDGAGENGDKAAVGGEEKFIPLDAPSYVLIDPKTEGVDKEHPSKMDLDSGVIKVTDNLFDHDAFIFDDSQVARATILYPDRSPYVSLTCKGFPSFGFWSKPHTDAPYICLEPWIGRCDNMGFDGELKDKYGEQELKPGEVFTAEFTIKVE